MASRLRVGVIGTGFGSLVQIPAFRAHARAEVVAVASGTPGKAKKTADALGVPHAFDDWTEARRGGPRSGQHHDAAAPPPRDGAGRVRTRAGTSSARSRWRCRPSRRRRCWRAATGRERVHVIDHELRFNPNRRKVRRLIEEGFIGVPRHVLLTVVNAGRHDPGEALGLVVRRRAGRRPPRRGRIAPGGSPALLARGDRRRHRHRRAVRPGAAPCPRAPAGAA